MAVPYLPPSDSGDQPQSNYGWQRLAQPSEETELPPAYWDDMACRLQREAARRRVAAWYRTGGKVGVVVALVVGGYWLWRTTMPVVAPNPAVSFTSPEDNTGAAEVSPSSAVRPTWSQQSAPYGTDTPYSVDARQSFAVRPWADGLVDSTSPQRLSPPVSNLDSSETADNISTPTMAMTTLVPAVVQPCSPLTALAASDLGFTVSSPPLVSVPPPVLRALSRPTHRLWQSGLRVGVLCSRQPAGFPQARTSATLVAGALLRRHWHERHAIQAEVRLKWHTNTHWSYSARRITQLSAAPGLLGVTDTTTVHVHVPDFVYLELPFVWQWHTGRRITWQLGGKMWYLLAAPQSIVGGKPVPTGRSIITQTYEGLQQPRRLGAGCVVGVEYRFAPHWWLETRWEQGLFNVTPADTYRRFNSDWQITLLTRF